LDTLVTSLLLKVKVLSEPVNSTFPDILISFNVTLLEFILILPLSVNDEFILLLSNNIQPVSNVKDVPLIVSKIL